MNPFTDIIRRLEADWGRRRKSPVARNHAASRSVIHYNPSITSKKIVKRLIEEHGFIFSWDPEDYHIVRDNEALVVVRGGNDNHYWHLVDHNNKLPEVKFKDIIGDVWIGSSQSAQKISRAHTISVGIDYISKRPYITLEPYDRKRDETE